MKMNWLCKRFTIFLGVPLPTPSLLKDNRNRSGSVAARPQLPDTAKIACEVEQSLVRTRGPRCACSLALCLHFVRLCGLSRAVRKYQNILITLACHQKGTKCKKFSNVLDGISFCALFHTSFFFFFECFNKHTQTHRRTNGRAFISAFSATRTVSGAVVFLHVWRTACSSKCRTPVFVTRFLRVARSKTVKHVFIGFIKTDNKSFPAIIIRATTVSFHC